MTATKSFDEIARYTVTVTATDVAGNEDTRTHTIDVLDLQFSAASDQVEYDGDGVATVAVTIEAGRAFRNHRLRRKACLR